jgi:hypothetical protein
MKNFILAAVILSTYTISYVKETPLPKVAPIPKQVQKVPVASEMDPKYRTFAPPLFRF